MTKVTFYDLSEISDDCLKFAVIAAHYKGQWIFCRHKERTTWEIPGGHRESGEKILETAKRELSEETGATEFALRPVCVYGVTKKEEITYGLLCFAEIKTLGNLSPEMEIGEIRLFDTLPENLTYPAIQPFLFEKVREVWNLTEV